MQESKRRKIIVGNLLGWVAPLSIVYTVRCLVLRTFQSIIYKILTQSPKRALKSNLYEEKNAESKGYP